MMNSVSQAIAPLAKVQKNLERVAAKRKAVATERREAAKTFVAQAEIDEAQEAQANAILAKLNKLLSPTEE